MPALVPRTVARARAHAALFPRGFWILLSGDVFQSLGFGLIMPYLTLYLTSTIGASPAQAGVLLALFTLGAFAGTPLGGVLSDRAGRRPVMLVGLAGSGAAALAFGLAGDLWAVAALIVVWAVFSSLFDPAASGYVADVAPPDLRTEAFALKRLVNNAAFAVGVPLGALLVYLSSLRAPFVGAGVAILVYLAILWRTLPESRPAGADADEPPARFREALRNRQLVVLALGSILAASLYSYYEAGLPVFLHDERGLAIATWGAVFGVNPILVTFFQYPIARWAARRSSRSMLALGALLYGVALAILLPGSPVGVLLVAIVVLSVGEMLVEPVSAALAADLAPSHLRGTYQSVLNLAWEIAWGPASIVGLWLVGRGQGELALALALPVAAASALLFLVLPGGRLQREPALVTVDVRHP
jgi:MFS family permease